MKKDEEEIVVDKLTLIEIAFAMPGADEQHGMKIADHKLICKVLDAHTEQINKDNLIENKAFKDKLISDAIQVIREELRPIKNSLKRIETKVNGLGKEVKGMKKVQLDHSKRLTALETAFKGLFMQHNKNHNGKSLLQL